MGIQTRILFRYSRSIVNEFTNIAIMLFQCYNGLDREEYDEQLSI